MSRIQEYIGCRTIDAVNYDGKGHDLCNVWLTNEEVIRCRDCDYVNDDPSCTHPRWHYGQQGVIIYPPVDLDGYCWLAKRSDAQ